MAGRDEKCVHNNLIRKSGGKMPLGTFRSGWEDIIKMEGNDMKVWTGFIRLRTGTSGGIL
jgi:hypothetical protein